jgi:hypothetical protein
MLLFSRSLSERVVFRTTAFNAPLAKLVTPSFTLKGIIPTTVRVSSAAGVKILSELSEGSPTKEGRCMAVTRRGMYGILVTRNLKTKGVTLHVLRPP